jgi:hypothetical protein
VSCFSFLFCFLFHNNILSSRGDIEKITSMIEAGVFGKSKPMLDSIHKNTIFVHFFVIVEIFIDAIETLLALRNMSLRHQRGKFLPRNLK